MSVISEALAVWRIGDRKISCRAQRGEKSYLPFAWIDNTSDSVSFPVIGDDLHIARVHRILEVPLSTPRDRKDSLQLTNAPLAPGSA